VQRPVFVVVPIVDVGVVIRSCGRAVHLFVMMVVVMMVVVVHHFLFVIIVMIVAAR
jgi:hypothetical protein